MNYNLDKITKQTSRGVEHLENIIQSSVFYDPSFIDLYGIGELQFNRCKESINIEQTLLTLDRGSLSDIAAGNESHEVKTLFRILDAVHKTDSISFTRSTCSDELKNLFIEILLHFKCHIASIYNLSGGECRLKTISVNGMTFSGNVDSNTFYSSSNASSLIDGSSSDSLFGADFTWRPTPGLGDDLAVRIDDNMIILFDDLEDRERKFTMHELNGLLLVAGHMRIKIAGQSDIHTGLLNTSAYYYNRNNGFHKKGFFLMADADNFKLVNDRLGRKSADQILAQIADILRDSVGPNDRVYRMGGEEFLIWICSEDLRITQAVELSSTILSRISSTVFVSDNGDCHVAISAGIARLNRSAGTSPADPVWAEEEEQAIELADRALYSAKRNGKNRVEFYE